MSKSIVPALSDDVATELSDACLVLGALSIVGSVVLWNLAKERDRAQGERLGIFVGLWAPTFFILSDRFARKR